MKASELISAEEYLDGMETTANTYTPAPSAEPATEADLDKLLAELVEEINRKGKVRA
jgi:hypothetical protein